jgi:hypothetical protein
VPDYVRASAANILRSFGSNILTRISSANFGLSSEQDFELRSNSIRLKNSNERSVSIVETLSDLLNSTGIALNPIQSMDFFSAISSNLPFQNFSEVTEVNRIANVNQRVLTDYIKSIALENQAVAFAKTDFKTRQQLDENKDRLVENLNGFVENLSSELVYDAINLRSDIINFASAQDLANLISLNLENPIDSINLAYQLYDDPAKQDFLDQNFLDNPGFIKDSVNVIV